jgi:hypothetical protein
LSREGDTVKIRVKDNVLAIEDIHPPDAEADAASQSSASTTLADDVD